MHKMQFISRYRLKLETCSGIWLRPRVVEPGVRSDSLRCCAGPARVRNEVVTDKNGSAFFKIQRGRNGVRLIISRRKLTSQSLQRIKEVVTRILQDEKLQGRERVANCASTAAGHALSGVKWQTRPSFTSHA